MSRSRILLLGLTLVLTAAAAGVGLMISHPSMDPSANLSAQSSTSTSGLTVRFLGTATMSFDDGSTGIMTDGFFSRPGIWTVLTGKVEPDESRIDESLKAAKVQRLSAIFVAHSHYDHSLDSAVVAQKTGAMVYGSESTANVVRGSGLTEDRIKVINDGDVFNIGAFRVTVFETPHSPNPLYVGKIEAPLHPPAPAEDYKLGDNYSFLIENGNRRILMIPSANYTPVKFQGIKADILFLGIGSLGKQSPEFAAAYWKETVQSTGAKLVIPIHWDDFMQRLDKPVMPMPRLMDDFSNSMKMLLPLAQKDGVTLRLPKPFESIDLDQR